MARTRTAGARRDHGPHDATSHRNPSRASQAAQSPQLRRSTRSRIHNRSMRELSSSSEASDDLDSASSDATDPGTESDVDGDFESRPRRRPSPRKPTQAKSHRQGPRRAPKRASKQSPKKRRSVSPAAPDHSEGTTIPDWLDPRVPYSTWTDIFWYAAVDGGADSLDVNWLVGAATICKELSEAALTAAYRCPPILTPGKARRLVALLDRPISKTQFNYPAKIESLFIDTSVVPQNTLFRLIHRLPRLRELVFFSVTDQPPYRQLDRTVRWNYGEDIFQAMLPAESDDGSRGGKEFHTRLSSWEWSKSLLGGPVSTLLDIARIHELPSFEGLTKIGFTNFQIPSVNKWQGNEETEARYFDEDGKVIKQMAEAISKLKHLKHLVFESSTVINDRLLPLLPQGLVHLSLINCWDVKAEDFAAFLQTHGRQLRTLVLSHNQSMDMSFLTILAESCPELEEIHMNLSYYRHHDSLSLVHNDADPLYEFALLPHQVPTWPSNIRVIDFEHVRHWSVEAAEMFLQSLLDSAGRLTNLRHIALKSMLNIPWKARADMRRKWRDRLDRIFLRPFEPPKYNPSLRQLPSTQAEEERDASPPKRRRVGEPSRRSGRIAAQASDSDSRSRNSKLRSKNRRPIYRELDTDEEDDSDSSIERGGGPRQGASDPEGHEQIIQGLCKTVSVVFDNQKPREIQYGMEDFLDNAGDGSDAEWDGDEFEDDTILVWN